MTPPTHATDRRKTVLITGASSGIGEAIALELAHAGHPVLLGARRIDRLDALVHCIVEAGGTAHARPLDVTRPEELDAFVAAGVEELGRVDVLVNNAGIMPLSALEHDHLDEWNQMIDVNIRGVLHGIRSALPVMRRQGEGQIVNIASTGAYEVSPTAAVYCATKYAVRAISDGLRQEVGPDITVTCLSPGVTESELAETITDPDAAEAMTAYRAVAIPASAVGQAALYAINQPHGVDVSEIVIRPA